MIPWGDGPCYCAGAEVYGCEAMLDEDEGSYCDECWERRKEQGFEKSVGEDTDPKPHTYWVNSGSRVVYNPETNELDFQVVPSPSTVRYGGMVIHRYAELGRVLLALGIDGEECIGALKKVPYKRGENDVR